MKPPLTARGSVLVYLVLLMLLFGVLGVIITSLFTTSTLNSATPNDARRAFYLAESGMRYAASELRAHDFDGITIKNLNSNTYTLDGGSFSINAFSPWFKSQEDFLAGSNLKVKIPVGKIPANFFLIQPADEIVNFTFVNFEFTGGTIPDTGSAVISSVSAPTATSMELGFGADTFVANRNETICLAVHPASDATLVDGGDLEVSLAAQDYFPPRNGAIYIVAATGPAEGDYFYENRIDDPANNKVILTNISKLAASPSSIDLLTTDYVILSPRNYMIIPTGTSGGVTYGGNMDYAMNIYDTTLLNPLTRSPDIDAQELTDNIAKIANNPIFIGVDTDSHTLNIGAGITGPVFGAAWYNADRPIGGKTTFCQAGACEFGLGMRAYFVVKFSTEGDGFTFALINGANNDNTSVGGDINMGELMAFAGDSRLVANPSDTFVASEFLDGKGEGLEPPKIGLEFDVYENSINSRLCADSTTANTSTRNDPPESFFVDVELGETAANRDVLQYVYWGSQTVMMPCKPNGNPNTYDDNRHDTAAAGTDNWEFTTSGSVKSSPALGADETIYFGADDNIFYALNPVDRALDQVFPTTNEFAFFAGDKIKSSPAVGSDGTIYFGSDDKKFRALYPNGTTKWSYTTGDKVSSAPALEEANSRIYVGSEDKKIYAFDLAGSLKWSYPTGDKIKTQPAIGSDGRIYVGSDDYKLWAFNPADRLLDPTGAGGLNTANEFVFQTGGKVSSSPAVSSDGTTIYFGSDDSYVYALNRADRLAGYSFPTTNEWKFLTGGAVKGHPAVDPNNGTIYVGSDDDKLYAFNRDGTVNWSYKTRGNVKTRPAIDTDGTVYVGSDKNGVYAFRPADRLAGKPFPTLNEWEFTADGNVQSSPVIGTDAVYVGADGGKEEGKLYAIQSFAFPRNERGTLISYSTDMVVADEATEFPTLQSKNDWLSQYDYAVRMEVMRSASVNGNGNYEYTSRTWIRRCENANCTDNNIAGTFFQDTRIQYAWFPAPNSFIEQKIEMTPAEHAKFDRMLVGFTGATGSAGAQSVLIKEFQLSFIRPNDPIVTDDSANYPVP